MRVHNVEANKQYVYTTTCACWHKGTTTNSRGSTRGIMLRCARTVCESFLLNQTMHATDKASKNTQRLHTHDTKKNEHTRDATNHFSSAPTRSSVNNDPPRDRKPRAAV